MQQAVKKQEATAKASLDSLQSLVKQDLDQVNAVIMSQVQSRVELIPLISTHLLNSGGKRIRPILTLACAKLCGYEGDKHIQLANCVEFIHSATLLHDDVVDESGLRRGLQTANEVWGNKASVLVGDYLLGLAFKKMVETEHIEVLKILSKAACVIVEGEVLQLQTTGNLATSLEDYMEVISSKTAALFAAACEVGPALTGNMEYREALRTYGMSLGVAFQITDDALDYCSKRESIGKNVGDDFREGKLTLPVIYAYHSSSNEQKTFWERTIRDKNQTADDFKTAQNLIYEHSAIDKSFNLALEHCNNAKSCLSIFPDGAIKSALMEAVDFCIERTH